MGCAKKLEIKKIFLIELIAIMLMLAITSPTIVEVGKAITDTITVTFNPEGNLTIDVSPNSWNAGSLYTDQSANTTTTYFTAYNNGTVTWATLYIKAASSADMTLVSAFTGASDEFIIYANGSATDLTTWTEINTNQTLETSVSSGGGSETFGLKITMDSVFSSDWAQQTSFVNLTAVGS